MIEAKAAGKRKLILSPSQQIIINYGTQKKGSLNPVPGKQSVFDFDVVNNGQKTFK